jgi:hypothetical protein
MTVLMIPGFARPRPMLDGADRRRSAVAIASTCALMVLGAPSFMEASPVSQSASPAPASARTGQETPPARSDTAAARAALAAEVRHAVDQAIADRLKDSRVVDLETSEAIASRLSGWAKLFAFFIGIPLAALAATLGFLGVRTYKDFVTRVAATRDDVLKRLEQSRAEAETIGKDFEALRAKLAEINALSSDVQALSRKVSRIEEVVKFKASADLTPTLKSALNHTLSEYQGYLKSIGLTLEHRAPTVVINTKQLNAYYLAAPKNQIVIHRDLAPFPEAALREFTHHVLSSLNTVFSADAGDPVGLESGLADYLPASFMDKPDFGRDMWPVFGVDVSNRNLENTRSFSEIQVGTTELHDAGNIWGGALWELRESMGRETIDKLILAAWTAVDLSVSNHDVTAFAGELLHQDQLLEAGRHATTIREVFANRDLDLAAPIPRGRGKGKADRANSTD